MVHKLEPEKRFRRYVPKPKANRRPEQIAWFGPTRHDASVQFRLEFIGWMLYEGNALNKLFLLQIQSEKCQEFPYE